MGWTASGGIVSLSVPNMKWVIFVLVLVGVVGVIGVFTNLDIIAFRNTSWGRPFALAFSVVSLAAAYGCWKKRTYGWYLVYGLIWASVLTATARAVYLALTIGLDWLGTLLGAAGEALKIGIFCYVVFRFWNKQRGYFKEADAPDPTHAPVTPIAGQPPHQS